LGLAAQGDEARKKSLGSEHRGGAEALEPKPNSSLKIKRLLQRGLEWQRKNTTRHAIPKKKGRKGSCR